MSTAFALALLAGLSGGAAVATLFLDHDARWPAVRNGPRPVLWWARARGVERGRRRWAGAEVAAGRPPVSSKVACALVGGLSAAIVAPAAPGRSGVLVLVAGPVAGFFTPTAWIERARRRALAAAVRDLPDMLDLLRVTVAAGLPPDRALAAVGGEFTGPLAREWRRVAAEVSLGVPPEQAFLGLSKRLPADEIVAFVDALERSRRHGVPLARALATQAARARHVRAQRLREGAAQAGPKIQLVVALLLVPSVLLIVAAGVVAELERSGLGALR